MPATEDPFRDRLKTKEASSSKSAKELDPAAEICQELEEWMIDKEVHESQLAILYKFSPDWETLWAKIWSNFDELEARRKVAHRRHAEAQAPSWHQSTLQYKKYMNGHRQEFYMAMPEKCWTLCPLSVHLDRYCKSNTLDRVYSWKATISNWNKFQVMYQGEIEGESSPSNQSFRRSLSLFQLSSYRILNDWWCSRYAPEELVAAVRSFIRTHESVADTRPLKTAESSATMADASVYHSYCLKLFISEFNPQSWEPYMADMYLKELQSFRYACARYTTAQRISVSNLLPRWKACKTGYPRIELNVSPLPENDSDRGYPYYLWDCEAQRTVVVSDYAKCPPYTCISHTWGRWRLNSIAHVEGVPWPVPENTLYNVGDLPRILADLSHAYIWLDLFCIPQDGSLLADYEISRQCGIFRGSTCCIAWFHDVDSWKGVENAIHWLGLKYLSSTARLGGNYSITEQMLRRAAESADTLIELMTPYTVDSVAAVRDPSSIKSPVTWFSSLWTLQEAIICPDLRLHSKDWTCLTDRSGSAITLTALMTFLNISRLCAYSDGAIDSSMSDPDDYIYMLRQACRKRQEDRMSLPLGPRDIIDLPGLTRLDSVLASFSPSRIFVNASIRTCSDSRAPAIMSALRITKWYSKRIEQPKPKFGRRREKLVLDIYPLPFIQEAFQVFGADLLDGSWAEGRRLSFLDYITRKARGTMLPFSAETGWSADRAALEDQIKVNVVEHEAVRGWFINSDGSFKMTMAGIFASSRDKIGATVNVHVVWRTKDNSDTVSKTGTDLRRWLQESAGNGVVYAIALYEDIGWQHGILLHSPPITVFGKRYLLKVGSYVVLQKTEMPPSSSVDWVVL